MGLEKHDYRVRMVRGPSGKLVGVTDLNFQYGGQWYGTRRPGILSPEDIDYEAAMFRLRRDEEAKVVRL